MAQPRPEPPDLVALFDRAAGLGPEERLAFLDRLRPTHPDVADELDSLLHSHDSDPGFLATPASLELLDGWADDPEVSTPPPATDPEAWIDVRCGDFRILRHIGAGGMSDVFEAEQARPRRRVAIKVLRPDHDSDATRARFAGEAEALARLDHPHIARIFGAGTDEGPNGPFFWIAVEHIPDATALTELAERQRLDDRARARLFLDVCDAVHHAHRKGVLHRDLKPANLLVPGDDGRTAKVIDFGLARLLEPLSSEEQLRTRTGELLGTLRYMSPEQCAGDPGRLDVRSDVYALGVVLFELLTGELPYDLSELSLLAVLDAVRSTPARALSDLRPELAGDLAAVLATALAKDPEERYDSAAALAADLRRWMASEPVLARRASLAHRARLFARRRTGLFAGLTAGVVAASVALGAILFLYFQGRSRLARVFEAEAATDQQRLLVTEARADLVRLQLRLDELLVADAGAAEALVEGARAASERAASPEARRQAVDDAVISLRLLSEMLAGDVESVASLAAAFVKVGDLHGTEWNASPEDTRAGLRAYQHAAGLWRTVTAADPEDDEARAALCTTLERLSQSCRRMERYEDARSYADEALVLARRDVERDPLDDAAVGRLIAGLWARGDAHIRLAPSAQGVIDSREALHWAERLIERSPDDRDALYKLAWSCLRAGLWVDREENDREEALALHTRGTDVWIRQLEHALETDAADATVLALGKPLWEVFVWNELRLSRELRAPDAHLARIASLLGTVLHEDLPPGSEPALAAGFYLTAALVDLLATDGERDAAIRRIEERFARLDGELAVAVRRYALDLFVRVGAVGERGEALRSALAAGDFPR
ncbi:MAG: serine/threonine-protein kinase [Planctomycetota bacterium]